MKRILPLSLVALLPGCAATPDRDRFPSLLLRAIESRPDAPVSPAVPVATPDARLDARIADWAGRLETSATAFETGLARADRLSLAARGSAPGSDAWLDAQVALAELDVIRTDTRLLISDLESAAVERAVDLAPAYPALDALIARAEAQVAAQAKRIATIESRLTPA